MLSRSLRPKRSIARSSTSLSRAVEMLEPRQLLAAAATSVFDVSRSPVFTPTTDSLRDPKAGPLAKGGAALVKITDEYRKFIKSGGSAAQFDSEYDDRYVIKGNMLGVTLRTRGSLDGLIQTVRDAGGYLDGRDRERNAVQAFLPIGQIRDVAARPEVMHVRPLTPSTTKSVGTIANEADEALLAAGLRDATGSDGAGVKIGVISDSYDANGIAFLSVINDELPPDVEVLQDDVGDDEGRAMLELIHDIAPGASLAFHAVGDSVTAFAAAIRALADAGCNIIVDDIGRSDNPFFQAGVIGEAVSEVVAKGVTYFTAQGNSAYAGYETDANWVTAADGIRYHDFNPDPDAVDTRLRLTLDEPTDLVMQWDNFYDGVVGDVQADVDVNVYDAATGQLLASSVDDNYVTGVPLEREAFGLFPGTVDVEIVLASVKEGGATPSVLRFVGFGGGFDGRKAEYAPSVGTLQAGGHEGTLDAIGVGAVDEDDTAVMGSTASPVSQEFSVTGPARFLFSNNGKRFKNPDFIQNPVIAGVDGTATSVFGFEDFEGTSAAAPNVAAVAALLKSIKPDATPADIRAALVATAESRPVNGQVPGRWDSRAGYGLVDAAQAANILTAGDVVTATIDRPSPNPKTNGINSVTVRFSSPVTGVDRSDFDIFLNTPGDADLITKKVTVEQIDSQTYRLNGLRPRTQALGTYYIAVNGAGIADADQSGNADAVAGTRTTFVNELRPPANLKAESIADGTIVIRWQDLNPSETGYRIVRSTDSRFRTDTKVFNLGANATEYVDNAALPSTTYYYRVQAVLNGQFGNIGFTSANSLSAGEVISDLGSSSGLFDSVGVNLSLFDDERAYGGSAVGTSVDLLPDGSKPANAYVDTNPVDLARGEYFVYARWVNNGNNASNVKYKVRQTNPSDGTSRDVASFTLNQSAKRAGGWVLLGKVKLDPKRSTFIRTDVKDATNETVVDAFRFLPASTPGVGNFGEPTGASLRGSPVAGRLVAGSVVTSNFTAERVTDGVLRIGPRGVIFE